MKSVKFQMSSSLRWDVRSVCHLSDFFKAKIKLIHHLDFCFHVRDWVIDIKIPCHMLSILI